MLFGSNTCKYGNYSCDPTWGLCKYCKASIELELEAKRERLRAIPTLHTSQEGAVGSLIGSLVGLVAGEVISRNKKSPREEDLEGQLRRAEAKVRALKSKRK
jgi:hypothetical protein